MPPGAHATLGASSASRWMACPGSVRLSAGLPDHESPYAKEGTAAHDLAERALRKGLDPDVWLDTEIDGVLVTEEMVEAVRVYVDHVRRRAEGKTLLLEHKFDLSPLNPPGPMFGTSDATVWCPTERVLDVIDYKHGQGVAVDASGNPQLRYYGLGAVLALGERPEVIRLTIVQPRAYHHAGVVRTDEMVFEDLVSFKRELMELAGRTIDQAAPLMAGDHCRFCKALPVCPEQKRLALEVAQGDFTVITPPAPETLTLDEIQTVLGAADQLRSWLGAVESHVFGLLDRGEEVPGWKLVDKRATRKWRDEADAETYLLRELGSEDAYTRKPLSPAQAEKALKALKIKLDEEMVEKVSSGKKLAPDTDPRTARLPSAQEDFDIPSAS
jgi:hypothetical protein